MTLDLNELQGLVRQVPGVQEFGIKMEKRRVLTSPEAVWKELEGLSVHQGWMAVTERVYTFPEAKQIQREAAIPLDAELLLTNGRSVHLRHRGGGASGRMPNSTSSILQPAGWLFTELARTDNGCGIRRSFLAEGRGSVHRVLYDIEWQLVQDAVGHQVLRPHHSRFAGFELNKEAESHGE